jgi:hypothetical protein
MISKWGFGLSCPVIAISENKRQKAATVNGFIFCLCLKLLQQQSQFQQLQ